MPNFEPEFYPDTEDDTLSKELASPREKNIDTPLNIHEYVVTNVAATFFMRMSGDAMETEGIYHNDLLVVDRSINPSKNHMVVVHIEGELMVKKFSSLHSEVEIWGVITFSLTAHT